jgi:hypothetical protein
VGVTVPSIDAMLAEIDRALAPPFVLPIGGPVTSLGEWCWKDKLKFFAFHGTTFIVPCGAISGGDEMLGLCPAHYDSWFVKGEA